MHNLEELISEWRKTMMAAPDVGRETLDELESHLRENVDQLIRSGMPEPEAFQRAVTQLGGATAIASEFQKLDEGTWLPVKFVTALGLMLALAMVIFVIVQLDAGRINFLLAGHVFLVGLGYTTTFLIGALGVCFVGQRCFTDLSSSRMRSLTRVSFILGCVATSMTAVGVLLGMIWAKAEWGRYWAWDIREIGASAAILWQVSFLLVHRFACLTAHGILTMSLLGNMVVSLGWFGANLLDTGLHAYGTLSYSLLLLVGVVSNLAFFLVALAPAGWLRLRKAPR